MKSLITRTYSYNNTLYKLRAGKEIPKMPKSLKKILEDAGYITNKNEEKAKVTMQEVTLDQQEHNIEEEEVFANLSREEDK